jgi:hypothetical protein
VLLLLLECLLTICIFFSISTSRVCEELEMVKIGILSVKLQNVNLSFIDACGQKGLLQQPVFNSNFHSRRWLFCSVMLPRMERKSITQPPAPKKRREENSAQKRGECNQKRIVGGRRQAERERERRDSN